LIRRKVILEDLDLSSIANPNAHASRHAQGGADEVVGIALQGSDAGKPSPGIPGRFWISTDTKALYYDDGSSWILIGRLAGLDLSSHASRHASGGADALPADSIDGPMIKNGAVTPDHLDAVNTPSDGLVPSYDAGTGKFEWVSAGGGGAADPFDLHAENLIYDLPWGCWRIVVNNGETMTNAGAEVDALTCSAMFLRTNNASATSNAYARIIMGNLIAAYLNGFGWDKRKRLYLVINLWYAKSSAGWGSVAYIGVGGPPDAEPPGDLSVADNWYREHVGIKLRCVDGGNLEVLGSVGDGSAETTATLETLDASTAGNRFRRITVDYDPSVPSVKFYYDGTLQGEITTGLPSGSSYAARAFANIYTYDDPPSGYYMDYELHRFLAVLAK